MKHCLVNSILLSKYLNYRLTISFQVRDINPYESGIIFFFPNLIRI